MKPYSKLFQFIFLLFAIAMVSCDEEDKPTEIQNGLVSVAGTDQTVEVDQVIQLDGSGSHDKNSKPFTYLWAIKTKPQASVAAFSTPNGVKTMFKPDAAGVYVIQLVLYQNGWSAKDELILTVTSNGPNDPTTVILDEDIVSSTSLDDIFVDSEQPDYIVTSDINVQADLTIMPGVIIEFEQNKGLQVITGSLNARGTSSNGIIFRGLNDSKAYWKGIAIYSNGEGNELDYVSVTGGGSAIFQETTVPSNILIAGTDVSGAAVKISNSSFTESGGYGLYIEGMSTLNGFSNNTFASNTLAAAFIPARELHKAETTLFFGNNGFEGIETSGTVDPGLNGTWKKLQTGSYLVRSNIEIKGGITIEAGAAFKVKNGVTVSVVDYGYLNATGSADAKIIFTSETINGRWNGLYFNGFNENNMLKYAEINNAGLNKIADSDHPGNIAIGSNGKLIVENSVMRNGLGYGLVAKSITSVNADVVTVNTFENLQKGSVFPTVLNYPDMPEVTGEWVDYWSFNQGFSSISENFYNSQTGIWFAGAATPWEMNSGKGVGIRFDENGGFIWTIAEHSPMTGCISYSAEYITGTANIASDKITFDQNFWRSKFINSCDPSQNVDTNVTTFQLELPYTIAKMYNLFTGEQYWAIIFTNPDNSTFSLYRK
jgi:hypothetical protein